MHEAAFGAPFRDQIRGSEIETTGPRQLCGGLTGMTGTASSVAVWRFIGKWEWPLVANHVCIWIVNSKIATPRASFSYVGLRCSDDSFSGGLRNLSLTKPHA